MACNPQTLGTQTLGASSGYAGGLL